LKKEDFERRCEEMRGRSVKQQSPQPISEPVSGVRPARSRLSLKDAASQLGVSYWTARRIFIAENVERYSTTGDVPVYPTTPLKRFQRVRMTYLITASDIDLVKKKMRGETH
jgi:hypothetical protein